MCYARQPNINRQDSKLNCPFGETLFLPNISPAEIMGLKKNQQIFTWLFASLAPLLTYIIYTKSLQPNIPPQVFWISLFHSCFLLNPFRSSDLNRILAQMFGPDEFYHLLPFIKTKAIAALMTRKSKYISWRNLTLFGIFSFLWLSVVVQLLMALFNNSPISWDQVLEKNYLFKNISFAQISIILGSITCYICIEVLNFLSQNIFGLFNFNLPKKNKTLSQNTILPNQISVVEKLEQIPFFSNFPTDQLKVLVEDSRIQAFEKGHFAIIEGEPGNEMFVIISGSFRLTKQLDTGVLITLTHISENAIFGEVAVLEQVTRTADAEALETSIVLNISRTVFHKLLNIESIDPKLRKSIRDRITLFRAMTQSRFFEDLPHELIKLFFEKSHLINPKVGGLVIKKGELGQEFYIVAQGSVGIVLPNGNINLSMGEFFGEVSLLDNSRRGTDVIANEGCVLMVIQAPDFFELIAKNRGLGINIAVVADLRKKGRR
jgi:CRP-like cAMP-binding protein